MSKQVAILMLHEHTIAHCGPSGIRVRDKSGNPIMKISENVYNELRYLYMRKDRKTGLYVIDKRKVRSLHGNSIIKKQYKKIKNETAIN